MNEALIRDPGGWWRFHPSKNLMSVNISVCSAAASFIFIFVCSRRCGSRERSPSAPAGSPCFRLDFLKCQEDGFFSGGAFLHSSAPTLLFLWGNSRTSEIFYLCRLAHSFFGSKKLHSQITNTVTPDSQESWLLFGLWKLMEHVPLILLVYLNRWKASYQSSIFFFFFRISFLCQKYQKYNQK